MEVNGVQKQFGARAGLTERSEHEQRARGVRRTWDGSQKGRRTVIVIDQKDKDVEVRTRSIPTAAALVVQGYEPVRIIHRDHGGALLVFAPAAREALDRYFAAKQRLDMILDQAENAR